MSRILSTSIAVFFMHFAVSTVKSLEVYQIRYSYIAAGILNRDWILVRQENSYFITCSQLCSKNPECTGVALGLLKEDRFYPERTCYLLNFTDTAEMYCVDDECSEEIVHIYQRSPPASTSPVAFKKTTSRTEVTTPSKETPITSSETTSSIYDTTTTEETPVCDKDPVIAKCPDNPERNVIVALKSSGRLLSDKSITAKCQEPFTQQAISSTKITLRHFKLLDKIIKCEEDELLAGLEICMTNEVNYKVLRCKKILNKFSLKVVENQERASNKNDRSEIRCDQGTFIVTLEPHGRDIYAKCGTLEPKTNPGFLR